MDQSQLGCIEYNCLRLSVKINVPVARIYSVVFAWRVIAANLARNINENPTCGNKTMRLDTTQRSDKGTNTHTRMSNCPVAMSFSMIIVKNITTKNDVDNNDNDDTGD